MSVKQGHNLIPVAAFHPSKSGKKVLFSFVRSSEMYFHFLTQEGYGFCAAGGYAERDGNHVGND